MIDDDYHSLRQSATIKLFHVEESENYVMTFDQYDFDMMAEYTNLIKKYGHCYKNIKEFYDEDRCELLAKGRTKGQWAIDQIPAPVGSGESPDYQEDEKEWKHFEFTEFSSEFDNRFGSDAPEKNKLTWTKNLKDCEKYDGNFDSIEKFEKFLDLKINRVPKTIVGSLVTMQTYLHYQLPVSLTKVLKFIPRYSAFENCWSGSEIWSFLTFLE